MHLFDKIMAENFRGIVIRVVVALASMACVPLSGCVRQDESNSLRPQLVAIEGQLSKARSDVDELTKQVTELRRKFDWNELTQDWDRVAYLTPGAEGYSTIRFDLGTLTVQLDDVKPYASGSKVTLRFGNTLSSSVNGLKAKIEWGHVDSSGAPDNNSQKMKELTFTQTLRGGAWTPVQVVLDGVPPAQLGFVRVSKVSHTAIRLAQ